MSVLVQVELILGADVVYDGTAEARAFGRGARYKQHTSGKPQTWCFKVLLCSIFHSMRRGLEGS